MENPAILLRRLNPYCARAMEGAASLCQTRAHAEILPEHWLLKLLEQGEGDLTVLARRYEWDMDTIWQDMLGFLDSLPRSVRSRPQLSEGVQSLMQDAWLHASLAGEEHIRSIHLLMALVEKPKLLRCDGLWPLLTLAQSQLERLRGLLDAQSDERPEVQQEAELTQGDEVEFVGRPVNADIKGELNPALQNALDRFTLDVTARAREGRIDPVYGRDNEIRQMVDILSRRRKNNPILVGEPGVGKTALVEGLALRIHEGNVPDALKPVAVRTLDLGLLQAGAGVKGEFEQRLKNIIDAVQQSPLPVLLFIDEAHTIIGAGILEVKHSETERFEQGYLVRGVQIEVTLDSNGFAGRGDICLFGEMMSRFFALYTDIYLFNRLIIILQPTGERLEWEEKHNRRIPG